MNQYKRGRLNWKLKESGRKRGKERKNKTDGVKKAREGRIEKRRETTARESRREEIR